MDPIQPPTQQPIQTPVQIPDFQPKPNYLKTVIFFVLAIITLGLIAYLIFQNQKLQKQVLNPQVSPTIQVPSPTSKPSSSISIPADEMVNWKIYTSPKANYSFKYPNSWPVVQVPVNVGCETCIEDVHLTPSYDPQSADSDLAVILVFKDQRIKTLDDYKNIIVKGDSSIINVQDSMMGTEKAVSYKLSGGIPPLPIIEYVVVKNNFYYVVRLEDSKETNKSLIENQKTFNQILSTFKFIDSISVCIPTYQVETNSAELTAKQNYSMRCTEQRSEKDCLSIDLYNQKADDFSIPDEIPDCIWKNPIK